MWVMVRLSRLSVKHNKTDKVNYWSRQNKEKYDGRGYNRLRKNQFNINSQHIVTIRTTIWQKQVSEFINNESIIR